MIPDPDYGVFAKAVETGSFSAAARVLRLSPSMVSKRVAKLEKRLGVQLLHRTTRRVAITEIGRQFYNDVASILSAIDRAEGRLSGMQENLVGALRVSAPTSFGRLHIAPNLAPFLLAHPQIELDLNLDDAFADFAGDRIDVAIRITRDPPVSSVARLLAPNRWVLCAAPDYVSRYGSPETLASLTRHKLLAANGQMPWRLSGPEGLIAFDAASGVRTNSSEVVRELAIAGLGIALRSLWDVDRELRTGRLVRVLCDYEGATDIGIYALCPQSSFIPAKALRFVDFMSEVFSPVAPWERTAAARNKRRGRDAQAQNRYADQRPPCSRVVLASPILPAARPQDVGFGETALDGGRRQVQFCGSICQHYWLR